MPSFLLEVYLPRGDSLGDAVALARMTAASAARGGTSVRYVRSMHLADDETCFHVFEASSRQAVAEAARRAGLGAARITETVESREALQVAAPSEKGGR